MFRSEDLKKKTKTKVPGNTELEYSCDDTMKLWEARSYAAEVWHMRGNRSAQLVEGYRQNLNFETKHSTAR